MVGQGLNSGIQDAFDLGRKLAQVAKGISPASLLQTCNEERLLVIPKILDLVADLSNKPWRSPQLGMLGINYCWSSIILNKRSYFRFGSDDELKNPAYTDSATELPVAGDHPLDAPGLVAGPNQVTSLFDILSVRHTIFLFTSAGQPETVSKIQRSVQNSFPHGQQKLVLVCPYPPTGLVTRTCI